MKEVGERFESNISVATVHHNFCSVAIEGSSVSLSSIGRDPVNSRQSIKRLEEKAWRTMSDPKVPELDAYRSRPLVLCTPRAGHCAISDGDGGG